MKIVSGTFSVFGLEVLNKPEGSQLRKAVEEVKGLIKSFIHVVGGHLHEATLKDLVKELDLGCLVFHLLRDDNGLQHKLNLLLAKLQPLDFLVLGLESIFFSDVLESKEMFFLSRLVGQFDEFFKAVFFDELKDNFLPELLFCLGSKIITITRMF